MGNCFCKARDQESPDSTPSHDEEAPYLDISSDLNSYVWACHKDPGFQGFDSTIQEQITIAIHSGAANLDCRNLSVESLRDVTVCFMDMNHEVVNFILESKRDVWKDPDLLDLVEEYLDNSLHTICFCNALDGCLQRAHHSQFILKCALQMFEEETAQIQDPGPLIYWKTLEQLKMFNDEGNPFTENFFLLFHVIYTKQVSMLNKLKQKKMNLDKRLRRRKCWRRISNAIFGTVIVSIIICSILVTAPPLLAALSRASSMPLETVGKWMNKLWKKSENELKSQRDMLNTMGAWSESVVIKDLQNIHALVDRFKIMIEGLVYTADFAMLQTDAVEIAVEDIKKNINAFMETAEILNARAEKCRNHIRMARAVILQKVNEQTSTDNSGNEQSYCGTQSVVQEPPKTISS